jgi:hypothetical protein
MFDDLTFALRYESTILIRIALLGWEIPLPITQETVEEMKRCGLVGGLWGCNRPLCRH